MSLIKKNQSIEIKIYFIEIEKDGYTKYVYLNDDEVKEYQDNPNPTSKLQCVTTKWKTVKWGEHQQILNQSITEDESGMNRTVDYYKFSDLTLKNTLIGWDLLDEDNKPYPLTPENIDLLPSDFVGKLSEKYNAITMTNPEDKKKLLR